MKIWLISDTHGKHEELNVPDGIDMILHAGDGGTYKDPYRCVYDLTKSLKWLNDLHVKHSIKHIIYVPGNHDTALEAGLIDIDEFPNIDILIHESIQIENFKIFGSPWTPMFYNWAYNAGEKKLHELWAQIPDNSNIIITHGPVYNILDRCEDGYRAGCKILADKVSSIKPLIHLCGHIHEDGGRSEEHEGTTYYNASVVNLDYKVVNNGIIIEI